MKKVRESAENYLETILLIMKEEGSCRSIDVARRLNYSKSSVSRGVNQLIKKGLLLMAPSGHLNFTDKGKKLANEIYEKHKTVTGFLEKIGVPQEVAEEDACRIEHVISSVTFEALKDHLKKL